jgi:hypothetical protein
MFHCFFSALELNQHSAFSIHVYSRLRSQLADNINAKIIEQDNRLTGVSGVLAEMDEGVTRAAQVLRGIIVRQRTDKLIMFWLFLIVASVFTIIIYHAVV